MIGKRFFDCFPFVFSGIFLAISSRLGYNIQIIEKADIIYKSEELLCS